MTDVAEANGIVLIKPNGTVNFLNRTYWGATEACCDFVGVGPWDSIYVDALIT
jgi:hypothetical protein